MAGLEPVLNIMNLLPEMLEKIFDFLEDPDDFLAVINTCQQWHDIMAYRKTERLFPKVLQVLEKAGVPMLMEDLLAVRQVSRKWKRVADTQPNDVLMLPKYTFNTSEEMERFVNHANSLPPGGNPFLGNLMRVTTEEHGLSLYESFLQLIPNYGTHLKKVELSFYIPDFPQRELITQLGLHLPNLEYLNMNGYIENWDPVGAVDALPALPRLSRLLLVIMDDREAGDDDDWGWGPVQENSYVHLMSSFVSTYGSQLEWMSCSPQLLRIPGVSDMLPNLKRLMIQRRHGHNLTLEDIQVFSQVGWRLNELTFAYHPFELTEEFLGLLNSFKDTLTVLRLSCFFDDDFDLDPLLIFPALKGLHLIVISRLEWIPDWMIERFRDVAEIFPNLEELEIGVVGINLRMESDYYINLVREAGVFPKLKKIELNIRQ